MGRALTCRVCGAPFPEENEGDYEGICPECSLELEDFGIEPDDEALDALVW